MRRRFATITGGAALRLCAVLWLFGYTLVVAAAAMQGRFAGGMMVVANLPLLCLGILQSVAISRLFDRFEGRSATLKWGTLILAGLVAAIVQTAADDVWLRLLAQTVVPSWRDWAVPYQPQRLFMILVLYCWTMFLSIALVWAARASAVAQANEARAASFAAAAGRAEAAALRLQLNPHFLFNTLNGITSLVVQRREPEAEEMLGRLADFLRSALISQPDAAVPIEQELETVAAYLDIERARFGDRLRVDVEIDDGARGARVPNFILQPLVENAIQHGVAAAEGGWMTIRVVDRGAMVRLEVTNGDGGVARHRGHGIGVENTRRRLLLHYSAGAAIVHGPVEGGYRVAIDLPRDGVAAPRAVAA